jgi:2-phosphosulfolactate phosphatase
MYAAAKGDMYGFLEDSSHRKRLNRLNMAEDVIYCLTLDQTDIVPVLKGDVIVSNKA